MFVAAGSRHLARIDDGGGVVCAGRVSLLSIHLSSAILLAVAMGWLWSYSQPQFIQPKMGAGLELGWVTSVLTCDTNPDSATPVLGTQR